MPTARERALPNGGTLRNGHCIHRVFLLPTPFAGNHAVRGREFMLNSRSFLFIREAREFTAKLGLDFILQQHTIEGLLCFHSQTNL